MFENLPVIDEANFELTMKEDLPYFEGLEQQCLEQRGEDVWERLWRACERLFEGNPELAGGVVSLAVGFANARKDRLGTGGLELCFSYITQTLFVLRLIDRALGAKEPKGK